MSLTTEQFAACEDILTEKMEAGEAFTAYDVTVALRQQGYWVAHRDVRDYVHACMGDLIDGGAAYSKELEWVTQTAQAFMYRPETASVIPTVSDYMDDDEDDDSAGIAPDGRGRLCIPASIVRLMGADYGDLVYCDSGNQKLTVKRVGPGVASYFVDKDCNVRISRRVLDGSVGPVSSYRVDYSDADKGVVVTPA